MTTWRRKYLAASVVPPRWLEIVVVTGTWLIVASIALVVRALDPEHPFTMHTIAVTAAEYLPWILLTPLIFALVRRYPIEGDRWARRLALHLIVAIVTAVTVSVVENAATRALGPPPRIESESPRPPFGPPGGGPRTDGPRLEEPRGSGRFGDGPRFGGGPRGPIPRLPLRFLIYLVVLGAGVVRNYAVQAAERREEAAALAAELSEARLRALRSQLNPHFLFNALNAVSALAGDDPATVRRIVARLSSLLRRVLDDEASRDVRLAEELAFLRDYLEIQAVRFAGRLEFIETIEPDTLSVLVPGLILQPIVENSVEHAAARRMAGVTTIVITARRVARDNVDRLEITVRDNGSGRDEPAGPITERDGGIGLRNTRERLSAHFAGDASLIVRRTDDGGTEAILDLPWQEQHDDEPRT